MSGDKIKELPSSSEAEQALLGCIIQGGEREQEIAMAWIRDNNAFYTTDNKHIWKSMAELYKDGTELPDNFVTNNLDFDDDFYCPSNEMDACGECDGNNTSCNVF